MSLKKFIFFITDVSGKCLQIVNGIVVALSQPKQLNQAPDGNQEISIGWERSPIYHGNIRTFSLPLGFVMEAMTMLRDTFYKMSVDARLFLLVKQLTYENTTLTYKEYYKQLYKGELDFSTGVDDQGGFRFNINIMEGGLQKQLKAGEGKTYEIPLDMDAKNVRMDGMYITGNFRWLLPDYNSLSDGYPGMFMLPNDSPVPGLAVFDVQQNNIGGAPDQTTLEYFAETTQDIDDVHLTGRIVNTNQLGAAGPLSIRLYIWNTVSGTLRSTIDLTPDDPYPQNYNLEIDEMFDMLEGDRLFFKAGGPFSESNLMLAAKSKPRPSVIKAFTVADLGRKLVEKMTGSQDFFESPYLDTFNILLTSGDGVRSLEGAAIKTTWRDYWKFVEVNCFAEMTIINNKIRITEWINAYDSTQTPITLGQVKNFKCSNAVDLLATAIKVGHAEQQVDDTNGKYDFNGWEEFSTGVEAIPDKPYDLQSNYKASPYEIEQMRANFEGKTTTDRNTDNDVYAIAALPDTASDSFETVGSFHADGAPLAPGEPLINIVAPNPQIRAGMKIKITGTASNDQDLTVKSATPWFFGQLIVTNEPLIDEASVTFTIQIIEGQYYDLDRTPVVTQLTVPDVDAIVKASVFNVPLSPKRILNKHLRWIAGMLYYHVPGKLTFISNNRNKELIADGIIEKADVLISDMGDPMFIPKYFEFDTVSPVNMTEALELQPNPVMSFIWKEITYTGFFIRGGIALNDREEQTFKLLACPENDLLTLI